VYLYFQLCLLRRVNAYIAVKILDNTRQKFLSRAAGTFFVLMFVPLVSMMVFGVMPSHPYPWPLKAQLVALAIWALGSMGSALILGGYDVFRRALARVAPPAAPPDLARRDFLRTGIGAVAAAPFVLSGYGALMERKRFEIERFDIRLDGLSGALNDVTVVQLTDLHVGPFMPGEELAAYVEAINRLEPDFIALTGDFVASSEAEVDPCVEALARLKARRGIYACLGNHDVYAGIEDEMTRRFAENNIIMLRNEAATHRIGDSALNIVGIDDLRWGSPDLPRALAAAAKDPGEVRLLLSHRPEVFPEAAKNGVEMILSGHYHGGQVKLGPEAANLSIARLLTPYVDGMYFLPRREIARRGAKSSTLFVGRGIGITGLPIRINCPPQIAHLTLKKA
ncbi:MAG TPA: metallophosphoesterase, partial [Candidatus Binatia bacterium]|nr:metallophosphoesterase [Candidatus Binatia bacterium]